MRPEPYDIKRENEMREAEKAMIVLWNKGLSIRAIRQEIGLDEFSEEYIEDVVTAPGNYEELYRNPVGAVEL